MPTQEIDNKRGAKICATKWGAPK